jgi:hypothetical protein
MDTNTKLTLKSCGCTQCRRGQASENGHVQRKLEQRAHRHQAKATLKRYQDEDSDVPVGALYGSYTD